MDEVFKDGAWEGRRVLSSARERLGKCLATVAAGAEALQQPQPSPHGARKESGALWGASGAREKVKHMDPARHPSPNRGKITKSAPSFLVGLNSGISQTR